MRDSIYINHYDGLGWRRLCNTSSRHESLRLVSSLQLSNPEQECEYAVSSENEIFVHEIEFNEIGAMVIHWRSNRKDRR